MTVRRDRLVLALTVFAVLFAQVLLYPGVDRLVDALGAGGAIDASTYFLAAEFAGFVLFAGAWGALSDALGRRGPLVTAGALGGALGYVALSALPGSGVAFWVVLVVRFAQGALTIGAFSLGIAMLSDLAGGHGRNMGAAGIAIGAGTALGAPVGGQLYALGPRIPVLVAAGVLAVAGLLVLLARDRAPGEDDAETVGDGSANSAGSDDSDDADDPRPAGGRREGILAALGVVREKPALGLPYAFGFIDRLTAGFFALVGTFYFRNALELSPALTGLMLGAFFAPFALLQYPMGIVSDRIGRRVPIALGSTLYGVVVMTVVFAPTVPLVALAMVLVGITGAFMAPATMALVADLAGERERGTAIGGFNVAGSLGFLAGILGGGLVASSFGYTAAFVAVGALEVTLALLALPALTRLEEQVNRARVFGSAD